MIEQGDLILVQLRGTLHGQRTLNTFWYYAEAEDPGQEEADLAGLAANEWNDTFQPGVSAPLSSEQKFNTVRAQLIRPNGTNKPTRWAYADVNCNEPIGQVGSGALPSTMAAVFRRRTALAGRKYRGRVYVPGIPTTYENDSILTQVGYDAITAGWGAAMIQAMVIGGSNYLPCITDAPLHSRITEVASATLDTVLRAQRRREVGVGE